MFYMELITDIQMIFMYNNGVIGIGK